MKIKVFHNKKKIDLQSPMHYGTFMLVKEASLAFLPSPCYKLDSYAVSGLHVPQVDLDKVTRYDKK